MIGGHRRCRPCSTIVAPSANRSNTWSLATWSPISAPKPPDAVYAEAGSTAPSRAMRMNGVRTPRRVISSSTASAVNRSSNPDGQVARRGQQRRAPPVVVGEPLGRHAHAPRQRGPGFRPALSRDHYAEPSAPPSCPSRFAPPSAVPSPAPAEPSAPPSWPPGVRAAVGGALARSGRAVGAAVVARRVRAAVGDALAAVARLDRDVVVSDGHAVPLLDRRGPSPRHVFGQRNERAAGWRWVDSRSAP